MGTVSTLMPLWKSIGGGGATIVSDGLVAEYRFDEGSGQVLTDYSGNDHHMQLGSTSGVDAGDPSWTSEGLTFVTDDYCDSSDVELRSAAWTIMVVMSDTMAAAGKSPMFTWGNVSSETPSVYAHYNANTTPLIYMNQASSTYQYFSTAETMNDGTYRCLTAQVAGITPGDVTSSKMWVNKTELSQGAGAAGTSQATKDRAAIGVGGTSTFLDGNVAYTLYYNKILSEEEIFQNYDYIRAAVAGRGISLPAS